MEIEKFWSMAAAPNLCKNQHKKCLIQKLRLSTLMAHSRMHPKWNGSTLLVPKWLPSLKNTHEPTLQKMTVTPTPCQGCQLDSKEKNQHAEWVGKGLNKHQLGRSKQSRAIYHQKCIAFFPATLSVSNHITVLFNSLIMLFNRSERYQRW